MQVSGSNQPLESDVSTSHYENISIDWATDNNKQTALVDNGQAVEYPLPKDLGTAKGMILNIADDISVYSGLHHYQSTSADSWYHLGEVDGQLCSDALMISMSWGAQRKNIDCELDSELVFDSCNTMFKRSDQMAFDVHQQSASEVKVTVSTIPIPSLIKLMGESNTQFLLESLNLTASPSASVVAIPHSLNRILNCAVPAHFTGLMKHLFAQAKVIEYLCELVSYFHHQRQKNTETKLGKQQSKNIGRDAHDIILSEPINPPSLSEIASMLGVSTRKLNQAFKDEFNLSPHQFIVNQRLTYAHQMLVEKRATQKQIAYLIGYSNVSHFNAAFKRHFGYTPGQIQANIK